MRYVGIDPSTKTGFVALDEDGNVLKQKELTGVGDVDPKRMCTLRDDIFAHIKPEDDICIEGFSFNSTGNAQDFQYGLGHDIRNTLWRRGQNYYEVAPTAVKKFVGVTGWTGEKGKMKRIPSSRIKKVIAQAVLEHFGFSHPSDNVVDAYIMAQIARALHQVPSRKLELEKDYQSEVVETILFPSTKTKKKPKRSAKK